MATETIIAQTPPADSTARRAAWSTLLILAAVNGVNYMDRMVLSLMIEPIKADFHLSDSQIGLLVGFAFAIFYTLFGIPLARYADRRGRVRVIGLSLLVWSGMTALCGAAQNFTQLFLARIGVGAGEAGCIPASHSLISERFPARRRALALGIFNTGSAIGIVVGLPIASLLAAAHGWRLAMVLLAIPGLILALVCALFLKEPDREGARDPAAIPAIGPALRALATSRTYVLLTIGITLSAISSFGSSQWMPAFFMRSYGISLDQVGAVNSLVNGVGVIIGFFLGGVLADRIGRRDMRRIVHMAVATQAIAYVLSTVPLLMPPSFASLVILSIASIIAGMASGPVTAIVQSVVHSRTRALASAVLALTTSLLGMGLGPSLAGGLSDALAGVFGQESLRYALLILSLASLGGIVLFHLAGRSLTADLARAEATE